MEITIEQVGTVNVRFNSTLISSRCNGRIVPRLSKISNVLEDIVIAA